MCTYLKPEEKNIRIAEKAIKVFKIVKVKNGKLYAPYGHGWSRETVPYKSSKQITGKLPTPKHCGTYPTIMGKKDFYVIHDGVHSFAVQYDAQCHADYLNEFYNENGSAKYVVVESRIPKNTRYIKGYNKMVSLPVIGTFDLAEDVFVSEKVKLVGDW